MTNIIIIEDEAPAMELMSQLLTSISKDIAIRAKLRSVSESIDYFRHAPLSADIIFSDVQLNDGLSFEIFRECALKIPVVFTTAYDQFMMLAFENNGIEYLLKPVERSGVEKAIAKYKNLHHHFVHHDNVIANLSNIVNSRSPSRLVVKKGMENVLLRLEDVILFYTENKLVFVIDRFQKKYIIDKTLSELEQVLDNRIFFRANRRYIVNLDYVKSFKPFEKVKLLIDLQVSELNHSIVVSQETAPAFRKWVHEA